VHAVDDQSCAQRLGLAEARVEGQEDEQRAERDGGGGPERRKPAQQILARIRERAGRTRRPRRRQFR
jgi:hypothetical protein